MTSKMKEARVSTKHHAKLPAEKDSSSPRLPHEMDESSDSRDNGPHTVIKRAFDDIEEGQLDTDRRGMPGVEEVHRKNPEKKTQEDIPASSRIPPSIPKK